MLINLFTDFGWTGPYAGELKAAVLRRAPEVAVVDLMHDAPAFRPKPAGYLLAALSARFGVGSVTVAVVDPGVGTARRALAVEADGRWFVGPDNGLLAPVARRLGHAWVREITWAPPDLTPSFHGRDLFGPAAVMLRAGRRDILGREVDDMVGLDWPEDLDEAVLVDGYGNVITGRRADTLDRTAHARVAGQAIPFARTFAEVGEGEPFWHANSSGLAEIAVNRGSAAAALGLAVGSGITWS